jgi:hypothetical protein
MIQPQQYDARQNSTQAVVVQGPMRYCNGTREQDGQKDLIAIAYSDHRHGGVSLPASGEHLGPRLAYLWYVAPISPCAYPSREPRCPGAGADRSAGDEGARCRLLALPASGTPVLPLLQRPGTEEIHHLKELMMRTSKVLRDTGHHRGISGQQMHSGSG